MAVDDLYHVVAECSTGGRNWEWIWDYQQVSGTNDARTMEELAIGFNIAFQNRVTDIMSADSSWNYTTVHPFKGIDEIPGGAQVILPNGQQPLNAIPQNMAMKALFITTAGNSKHNGSTNWSGIAKGDQVNGFLTAAALTRLDLLLIDLLLNITGIGTGSAEFQPVVVSRVVNGATRPAPVPFAIVSAVASTRVGNMRRRSSRRKTQV